MQQKGSRMPGRRTGGRPPGSRTTINTDAVFQVREALGLTQEETARELHCSLSAVRRFEREKVLPVSGAIRDNFNRLAKKAGVEIQAL